jgi:hypothetical protein
MSKKRHDHRFQSDMSAKANPPADAQTQKPQAQKPKEPNVRTSKSRKPAAVSHLIWRPVTRTVVSLLLAFHILAVFVAPWNLSTGAALPPGFTPETDSAGRQLPPPAPEDPVWQQPRLIRTLADFFWHYQNLAYLNHGYEFFAPDPAGTHLIRYQVTRPDGRVVEGHFPDLKEQWPRLFYHRHMMLAEQTAIMGEASGNHYAEHLARVHGGRAQLQWVVHMLLSPDQVKDGKKLDDPDTYQVLATVDAAAPPVLLPPVETQNTNQSPTSSAIIYPRTANGGGG